MMHWCAIFRKGYLTGVAKRLLVLRELCYLINHGEATLYVVPLTYRTTALYSSKLSFINFLKELYIQILVAFVIRLTRQTDNKNTLFWALFFHTWEDQFKIMFSLFLF